jgi:Tfp pilus assembly protein PilF
VTDASNSDDEGAARLELATRQLANGKPARALQTLRPQLSSSPEDSEVLTIYGLAHLSLKNTRQAKVYLEKAHKLKPNGASALNLSSLYLEAGEPAKASKVLRRFEKKYPDYLYLERVHQNRGVSLLARNRLGDAISAFEAALSINPTYYPAVLELAKLYARVQERRKAEAMWSLAKGQCPQCLEPVQALVQIYRSRRNEPAARQVLTEYLNQDDIKVDDRLSAKALILGAIGSRSPISSARAGGL